MLILSSKASMVLTKEKSTFVEQIRAATNLIADSEWFQMVQWTGRAGLTCACLSLD